MEVAEEDLFEENDDDEEPVFVSASEKERIGDKNGYESCRWRFI